MLDNILLVINSHYFYIDAFLLLLAEIILFFALSKLRFDNRFLCLVISLPFIVFSLAMVSEAVMIDEWQYMTEFININRMNPLGEVYVKTSYQYRFSEGLYGTIFLIIRYFIRDMSDHRALVLYKMFHWLLCYVISVIITSLYASLIKGQTKVRIQSTLLVLYSLIALPVACYLMKICNYDSMNSYLALLGIAFGVYYYKKKKAIYGILAVIVSSLGSLEKNFGVVYLGLTILVLIYASNKKYEMSFIKRLLMNFAISVIAYFTAIVISITNLFYIRFLQGQKVDSLETAIYPITYIFDSLLTRGNSKISILLLICVSAVFSFLVYLSEKKFKQWKNVADTVTFVVIILMMLIGVIGAFCLKQYYAEFIQSETAYIGIVGGGSKIYYPATTKIGFWLMHIAFFISTYIAAYPTVYLLYIFLGALSLKKSDDDYLLYLLYLVAIVLPLFKLLGGMPTAIRQFMVEIELLAILSIYYFFSNELLLKNRIVQVLSKIGIIVFGIEMIACMPNYGTYSPIWLIRNKQFLDSVELGVFQVCEGMHSGEEMAIGTELVNNQVKENGQNIKDIIIYCNYTTYWLGDPGYDNDNIHSIRYMSDEIVENIKFSENEYFILSQTTLFRHKIPAFLDSVTPVAKHKVRGETTIWVYRGDQLKNYKDYFNGNYGE